MAGKTIKDFNHWDSLKKHVTYNGDAQRELLSQSLIIF